MGTEPLPASAESSAGVLSKMTRESVPFGSLCSGIDGMALGLERAGMTCRWHAEVDPWASALLAHRWPRWPGTHWSRRVTPQLSHFGSDAAEAGG